MGYLGNQITKVFPTSISELMFDSTGDNEAVTTSITFQLRDYIINE